MNKWDWGLFWVKYIICSFIVVVFCLILIVFKLYWYDINFESWRDWIEMVFNNYRKISIVFYNDCLFLCCDNRELMIVFEDL